MWHEVRLRLHPSRYELVWWESRDSEDDSSRETPDTTASNKTRWTRLTRRDIATHGVWASAADFVPWGGVPHTSVTSSICVFGIPVEGRVAAAAQRLLLGLDKALPRDAGYRHGLVMYHGTTTAAWSAMAATVTDASGLQLKSSSTGMLGPGVYTGTFWKAIRFATREGHSYQLRQAQHGGGGGGGGGQDPSPAVVLRVRLLVDVRKDLHMASFRDVPCRCKRYCSHAAPTPWADACRHVVDHEAVKWRVRGCVGAAMLPEHGVHADFPGRRVVSNAEVVTLPHVVVVRDAAAIDMASIQSTPEGHYDPCQRSQRIL